MLFYTLSRGDAHRGCFSRVYLFHLLAFFVLFSIFFFFCDSAKKKKHTHKRQCLFFSFRSVLGRSMPSVVCLHCSMVPVVVRLRVTCCSNKLYVVAHPSCDRRKKRCERSGTNVFRFVFLPVPACLALGEGLTSFRRQLLHQCLPLSFLVSPSVYKLWFLGLCNVEGQKRKKENGSFSEATSCCTTHRPE